MRKVLKIFLAMLLSLSSLWSRAESETHLHSTESGDAPSSFDATTGASSSEETAAHSGTRNPETDWRESLFLSYHERLALNYLIAGAGKKPSEKQRLAQLLKQELLRQMLTPFKNREVESFDEFLKAYKGDWPNALSIDKDLELIRKRPPVPFGAIYSMDPQVQVQIDAFHQARRDLAKELYKKSGISLAKIDELILKAREVYDSKKPAGTFLIGEAQAFDFEKAISQFFDYSEKVINYGFGKIHSMAVPLDVVQSGSLSQDLVEFVVDILQDYFQQLSFNQKKQIIADILGADLVASPMDTFETFIMGSGPILQKFLQVIAGDESTPQVAKDFFKKIEDALPQLPPEVVAEIMEKARIYHHIQSYESKALGVGTLAQTHLGVVLEGQGENAAATPAVIRYLKPGIKDKVEMDARILKELAPKIDSDPRVASLQLPKVVPLVDSLVRNVQDEESIFDTKLRQRKGTRFYSRSLVFSGKTHKFDLEIYAPDIMDAGVDSSFHIQHIGQGKKLDDVAELYRAEIPDLKGILMAEIAKVWLEEGLFRSGFYHGDLHQGNFLIDIVGSKISVAILDFGMGGTLRPKVQKLILGFAAGVKLLDRDMIIQSIWGLEKEFTHKFSRPELAQLVDQELFRLQKSGHLSTSLNQWAIWATNLGILFDDGFVGFNRGLVVIEKNLKRAESSVSVEDIVENMLVKYSPQILRNMNQEYGKKWYDFVKPYLEYQKRQKARLAVESASHGIRPFQIFSCRKPTRGVLNK